MSIPKVLLTVATIALAGTYTVAGVASIVDDPPDRLANIKVECPEEDSCDIDYRSGGWYVNDIRVTK